MSLWSRIQRQLGDIAGDLLADETRAELELARELLAEDPTAVIPIVTKVLDAEPDHAIARALLASAHLELGDARTASEHFDKALTSDSSLPEALLGKGESALALGRPEDAISPYHRAIEEAGGNRGILAEAYRGLGVAYRRLGEREKAIRELRKAVAEDADDPVARAALGDALVDSGAMEEARRHLRRAGDAEVVPSLALVALARLALAEDDAVSASEMLKRAHTRGARGAFEPTAATILTGMGDAAMALGELEDAKIHYEGALKGKSGDGEVLAKLAELHELAGDYGAALDAYRQSLETGETLSILERAVSAAIHGGTPERRAELADRLLGRVADHPRAMVAKALALADQGAIPAARTILVEATKSGSEPLAYIALAELELGDGDLERAAEHALAALRLTPRGERARGVLADVRGRQLEAQIGPSDPKHVTDEGDAALYQLAVQLADLLATRPELAGLAPEASGAATDFDRPLLVTVMGEFSSGKSSFVNAFIGEDIAPTGITPTTATINVVKYGRQRSGRLIYQDGRTESLSWDQLFSKLRELTGRAAAQIAQVEILLPLEELERVHIVDTPGLNSILPEHETVARDFISRADAVVWVFSAGQAGKKSERLALEGIRDEGKRILGVLNKVDQLRPEEAEEVQRHVAEELSDLIEVVVPVSARRALEGKASGAAPDQAFAALEAQLETRFFAQARDLKRQALDRRLRLLLERARTRIDQTVSADGSQSGVLREAAERVRDELVLFLDDVVDRERAAMREASHELYRAAAREILELVRPRRLPFGSHQATPADRDYLIGLLEAGYDAVVGESEDRVTRELDAIGTRACAAVANLASSQLGDPSGDIERAVADATRWVRAQVFGRTGAYVRGYLRGGYVATFFRRDLPKIDLDEETIYQALYPSSPDLDAVIALPLARASADALSSLAARLEHLADVADLHGFDLDVGIVRALERTDERRRALGGYDGKGEQANTGD